MIEMVEKWMGGPEAVFVLIIIKKGIRPGKQECDFPGLGGSLNR
jgi:hypothetical protein